ncbi:hypothetical protein Lal_00027860 [Lupinus albus]|nr:hypothetical protein Lal_00027860 [Lupinus albus]
MREFDSLYRFQSAPLAQRNTNQAQPTTHDLKLMFAILEGILVNCPAEILKVMSVISSSSSRLLSYGIFMSRIIDYMEIETSDVDYQLTNTHDHLVGESLIHKMDIYWLYGEWMYQEDYKTTIDLELSDEETPTGQPEQPAVQAGALEVPHASPFGLAHLDAMEQRLNQRMDAGFQALNDIMDSRLICLYDRVAADIQRETV